MMVDFRTALQGTTQFFRSVISPRSMAGQTFSVSAPASNPIVESGVNINLGGDDSNATYRSARTIAASATAVTPPAGYTNLPDLTNDYSYTINYGGWNVELDSNGTRSGIYDERKRLIHAGQGDFVGNNVSIRGVQGPLPGVTHWLASPAIVGWNGTFIAEVDGIYLNPRELVMTDKPGATAYNVTAIGDVVNMNRNSTSGVSLGQVWHAWRVQNSGTAAADTIISGTGKFFSGIDLSMPALDFGARKGAIFTKAEDRFYPNASADEMNDGTTFIRANHRATTGFDDYSLYTNVGVSRWSWVTNNTEAFSLSDTGVNAVKQLNIQAGAFIANGFNLNINGQRVVSNRDTGWTADTGTAKKTANATYSGTASGTYTQSEIQTVMNAVRDNSQTLKAIKDALIAHGLIGA